MARPKTQKPKKNSVARGKTAGSYVEADQQAGEGLGDPEKRSHQWREQFRRALDAEMATPECAQECAGGRVARHTLYAYLGAMVSHSNAYGADVWPGMDSLAERTGLSIRQLQRARRVARRLGWERWRRRRWKDRTTGAWRSASTRVRLRIPARLAGVLKSFTAKVTRRQARPNGSASQIGPVRPELKDLPAPPEDSAEPTTAKKWLGAMRQRLEGG